MAVGPGSSEGAVEVVAGVGQLFKMELERAAASPAPVMLLVARRADCLINKLAWLAASRV